jgi:molybdopterin-binding protein
VKIDVGGTVVTASITNQAVDELGLKVGDDVPVHSFETPIFA